MTKWARIRRRKERRKAEAEERRKAEELQRAEPEIQDINTKQEKVTESVQHTEKTFLKRFSMPKKSVQQEKAAESIKDIQREGKLENTQIQAKQPILSQIPRYVYLVAFFALLSGVFFPLITEDPTQQNPDNVIKGTAILFLGLFGAILVYKGTTDKITGRNNKRATLISFGLGMIAASLALIFTIASTPS
jgi:hypothetical protein